MTRFACTLSMGLICFLGGTAVMLTSDTWTGLVLTCVGAAVLTSLVGGDDCQPPQDPQPPRQA